MAAILDILFLVQNKQSIVYNCHLINIIWNDYYFSKKSDFFSISYSIIYDRHLTSFHYDTRRGCIPWIYIYCFGFQKDLFASVSVEIVQGIWSHASQFEFRLPVVLPTIQYLSLLAQVWWHEPSNQNLCLS